jgi:hypothetical protein
MSATYKAQILHGWDWPGIVDDTKRGAENHELDVAAGNVPECGEGCDEDGHASSSFLGRHYFMFPSQKFYAPWSVVSAADRDADQRYATALETVADKFGGWIESGEGDPTDVFFCRYWTYDELGIEKISGMCDCGKRYIAASRTDHCPEDGTCWEHCPFGHTAADWND